MAATDAPVTRVFCQKSTEHRPFHPDSTGERAYLERHGVDLCRDQAYSSAVHPAA